MEVGIVEIPAAELFAGRGLARHGAKRLEETVFAEVHENGVGVVELVFVEWGMEGNVGVGEFEERKFVREVGEEVREAGSGECG